MGWLESIKAKLKPAIESNVYLNSLGLTVLRHCPFLLPHDADYLGFRHFLKADGTPLFLDIGANIGLSALSFRSFDKSIPIVSIEPNPCHEYSLASIKKRDPRFDYRLFAVGDAPGSFSLYVPYLGKTALHTMASLSNDALFDSMKRNLPEKVRAKIEVRVFKIEVVTVDSLGIAPSMVKIDVEGFEDGVLRGSLRTLKVHQPVLLLEKNPATFLQCQKTLSDLGYRPYWYDSKHDRFSNHPNESRNVFFLTAKHASRVPC